MNLGRDFVALSIIIYIMGRGEENCLSVDNNLITLCPIQGMMAHISVSGPNVLFYIENLGRDLVVLSILIIIKERREENCLCK